MIVPRLPVSPTTSNAGYRTIVRRLVARAHLRWEGGSVPAVGARVVSTSRYEVVNMLGDFDWAGKSVLFSAPTDSSPETAHVDERSP